MLWYCKSKIENLVTCTGKTKTPAEQLLHGADKDNLQPQKETLSKHKVHTRKPDGKDSSYNSSEVSDSNFTADENLVKKIGFSLLYIIVLF